MSPRAASGWPPPPPGTAGTRFWSARCSALGECGVAPDVLFGVPPPGVAVELHRTPDWPAVRAPAGAKLPAGGPAPSARADPACIAPAMGTPHTSRWQTRTSHLHLERVASHASLAWLGRCTCQ